MLRVRQILSLIPLVILVSLAACSRSANERILKSNSSSVGLRPLTTDEALADFHEMVADFRNLYGPLEYKEKRFGFSLDAIAADAETAIRQAKNDAEVFAAYSAFLAHFHDAHVGIQYPANSTGLETYSVPLFIAPFENRALVASVKDDLKDTPITVGDEVVEIDGQTPFSFLPIINKYATFGFAESDKHYLFLALKRPFYMTELVPKQNTVRLKLKKVDGTVYTQDLVWRVTPTVNDRMIAQTAPPSGFTFPSLSEFQRAADNSLLTMAQPRPFFTTEQVMQKYGLRIVTADDMHRKKYGLADTDKPDIFAALYRYKGRTILLVRNYVYQHRDFPNSTYMKAYKAILDQWEELADVLVVDQTHNGGGSYCEEFFRLFIQDEKNGFVQKLNVDRKWMVDLRSSWTGVVTDNATPELNRAFASMASEVEAAYDHGHVLTSPVPIIGGHNKVGPLNYTWKKPMLVLIDELAISCGDAFPMLIKSNNVAKLFGQRTAGAGGNVEMLQPFGHSQARLHLTRGLYTSYRDDGNYPDEVMMENNGVAPDYPYSHTIDDFRAGFVGYVGAFSEKALEQIPSNVK